jgi:hypothetical protein
LGAGEEVGVSVLLLLLLLLLLLVLLVLLLLVLLLLLSAREICILAARTMMCSSAASDLCVVWKSGVISLRSLFVARAMKAVFAHQKQTDFLVAARLVDKDCSFFVTARFLLGVVSSLVVLI